MKTICKLILFTIAFLVIASCEKREEIFGEQQVEITAMMECADSTRTSLSGLQNGNYYPLWSEEDEIAVFLRGDTQPVMFKLYSGAGTTEAKFMGAKDGADLTALYPYSSDVKMADGKILFSLPSVQKYVAGSFGEGCYPMLAKGGNGVLNFKNLCSVLKISLYGKGTVENITLTANDKNTFLSGKVTASYSYSVGLTSFTPKLAFSSGGSNAVKLECGSIVLASDKATDFYLVIPAQTYKGGLTVTIGTTVGNMVKSISKDLTFERSQLRELESFELKLDEDVDPSVSLQGEGTESSPFQISKLADLLLMQEAINSPSGRIVSASADVEVDARSAHYKLMADIDLSAVCGEGKGNWVPIGNYWENEERYFKGIFDGGGHTIKGLYIVSDESCQGLFGRVCGKLKNLSVDGVVAGGGKCGLICGYLMDNEISDCTVYGKVYWIEGDAWPRTFGGIVGTASSPTKISNCINYADVNGENVNAGGVAGESYGTIINCKNYGNVKVDGEINYAGGIVGDGSTGKIYSSFNGGKVSGNIAGGIAGYHRGYGVYNSCNYGEVEALEIVGGIVGMSNNEIDIDRAIKNCINVGTLKTNSASALVGAICGKNKFAVSNCYWLYDEASNTGIKQGLGENDGDAKCENVFALTAAQMRGEEDYNGVLFMSPKNIGYSNIMDALNVFSYYNTTWNGYRGIILNGWEKDRETGYPILKNERSEAPDEVERIFEVSVNEIAVSYGERTVGIVVKANMDYHISSLPDWITEITTKVVGGNGKNKEHMFTIAENTGPDDRLGAIEFCNEEQVRLSVAVTQISKPDWITKEFSHKSLAMRFTADWCGYCPRMAEAMAGAKKLLHEKLEVLSVHASGGLHAQASDKLAVQYKVSTFPTGYVDGREKITNYSDISQTISAIAAAVNHTETQYETLTGASWNSAISNNKVSLDLQVYFKESGSYKVTALLVEDNIIAYQYGVSGNYVHNDVVRGAFSNPLGDAVETFAGSVENFNYTMDVPDSWNKENLRIVVYIQKVGKDKLHYVNNSASAGVGKKQPLMFEKNDNSGTEDVLQDDDIPYKN